MTSLDPRPVAKCRWCKLVQFVTERNLCRRCKRPLTGEDPPAPIPVKPKEQYFPMPAPRDERVRVDLALRLIRFAYGLSQRDAAALMKCPRTYISKVENAKAVPTVRQLVRIAKAFDLTVAGLITIATGGSSLPVEKREAEVAGAPLKDAQAEEILPLP